MKYSDSEILKIIVDFYTGNISTEEKTELDRWVASDVRNEEMFRECLKLCNYVKLSEKAVSCERIRKELSKKDEHPVGKKRRFRRAVAFSASAAAILIAGYFIFGSKQFSDDGPITTPGSTRAVLVNGDIEIELDGSVIIKTDDGFRLLSNDGREIYASSDKEKKVLHRLFVPRGGEFDFTLEDGTHVWLNSESELIFPIKFSDNDRRVTLTGEAFFDVAKNPEKPFIVSLSAGDITVFGTRFCISDYKGYPISAVLVEGSIGFTADTGESVMLAPSHRMVYDRETGDISIDAVNTSRYTAWTRNMFIFDGQTLNDIMITLSRWYDVDVVFESEEVRTLKLSGQLSRDQDIRVLLDAYREIAGVNFRIESKTIHVGKAE